MKQAILQGNSLKSSWDIERHFPTTVPCRDSGTLKKSSFVFVSQNHTSEAQLISRYACGFKGRPPVVFSSRVYPATLFISVVSDGLQYLKKDLLSVPKGCTAFHFLALVMRRSGVRFSSRAPKSRWSTAWSSSTTLPKGHFIPHLSREL